MPELDIRGILAELNREGVEFLLIGGVAVGFHGYVRATKDVDIVPSFVLHHITWNQLAFRYETASGVAILGRNGGFTLNYPGQHHENGIAKRGRIWSPTQSIPYPLFALVKM